MSIKKPAHATGIAKRDIKTVQVAELVKQHNNSAICDVQEAILPQIKNAKFKENKKMSLTAADFLEALFYNARAERVRQCGSWLQFAHLETGEQKLINANFCRDRMCPMCAWRRSLKNFCELSQVMNVLESQGYIFLFLTLTMKNCICEKEDFKSALDKIFRAWKNYIRRKEIASVVHGSFRTLEVTYNKTEKTLHPHLHVVLAVKSTYFKSGKYLSQAKWRQMWREALEADYEPLVHVKRVQEDAELGDVVEEVTKYVTKTKVIFAELPKEEGLNVFDVLTVGLKGRRLISVAGVFRDVAKSLKVDFENDADAKLQDEIRGDVAYAIVNFFWRGSGYVAIEG